MTALSNLDVLILCGGLGRRLRSAISGRPKPMAEINNRPFLEILLAYLLHCGFRRIIFSTGFKGEDIKKYFRNKGYSKVIFSQEKDLLGTGGAVKKSRRLIKSNPFFVINGDSFCKVNFEKFLNFHRRKNALLSVALVKKEKRTDCGFIRLDSSKRVVAFNEKAKSGSRFFINAGIYIFQREVFNLMPVKNRFSLECDFFPDLAGARFYGHNLRSALIDIGTPSRLKSAESYFRNFKFG